MTEAVIFDFDGVILDSEKIKDEGFRAIFSEFDKEAVDCLIAFHKDNGGLSRFIKIRYMFETILHREITDDTVMKYAMNFSELMLSQLTNPDFLIKDTVDFIRSCHGKLPMHVASGTEQTELRSLAGSLGVSEYFDSILGSPADKAENLAAIIKTGGYNPQNVIMIGDSTTDFRAARANNTVFCGYNNKNLISLSDYYITDYAKFAEKYRITG